MEWTREETCYRAVLPVDLPEGSMVVTAYESMSSGEFQPYLRTGGGTQDVFSTDVVVCGKESEGRFVLAGAATAFRSRSFFTVRCWNSRIVEIEVRQPEIRPGERPEEVVVLEGDDWRELLVRYADLAAARMGARPARAERNLTGYCTWYYYYKDVTQQHLLENVEALARNRHPYAAEYVQIDDGYQTFQGDWRDRAGTWPVPLDETAARIVSAGMKAGIWTMPFTASTASRVYREHPDWFVKDDRGGTVLRRGWTPAPDHLWACLDATRPEVREHLAGIFRDFRAMGYTYFKMDGLRYGLAPGRRLDPDATAVSAFRLGLRTIREAVPDSILMACSEPYLPCLGLVDNARVSNDTSRHFVSGEGRRNTPFLGCDILSAFHLSLANFWKFDRWFRCDPDVVMARQDNAFYTREEAKFSVLAGIMTGVSLTSDHLGTIAPDRNELLARAQDIRMRDARPFLAQPGQWPSAFEGRVDGRRAVALLNSASTPLQFAFADLGLPPECIDLLDRKTYDGGILLPVHDAVLLTGR